MSVRTYFHLVLLSLSVVIATGCRTFHRETFDRTVVTGIGDSIPTTPVHAGYSFRTLDSIGHGDLIYVTYRDSLNVPSSVLADYDQHRTIDSSLVLYHVRDSGMPKSLSIAFRNVDQVYPLDRYKHL